MELKKLNDKTYYIDNPTNIGIYLTGENECFLIDSGNDKEAGRKISKILEENNWQLKGIISTHSNADHIGGNSYLQNKYNCPIFSTSLENTMIDHPILEPSFLFGAFPLKAFQNKYLMAKPSVSTDITSKLPEGLELISLKGHFLDMIGIKTADDIYFLADSLASENAITKYHIFFLYDVKEYLKTLDYLESLNGKYFIASHSEIMTDIKPLIKINRDKIKEIINKIITYLKDPHIFEDILKELFDSYHLELNASQYALVGSTIKSYLSYLESEGQIAYEFQDNKMYWKSL